jgi:hypothetical protein
MIFRSKSQKFTLQAANYSMASHSDRAKRTSKVDGVKVAKLQRSAM